MSSSKSFANSACDPPFSVCILKFNSTEFALLAIHNVMWSLDKGSLFQSGRLNVLSVVSSHRSAFQY